MFNLSTKRTVGIAVVFSLILWATRGQHMASMMSLPDATWAIAFMLGFLLSPILLLIVLVQAFVIDYLAMGNYLLNAAYAALVPAYLALWLGWSVVAATLRTTRLQNWSVCCGSN